MNKLEIEKKLEKEYDEKFKSEAIRRGLPQGAVLCPDCGQSFLRETKVNDANSNIPDDFSFWGNCKPWKLDQKIAIGATLKNVRLLGEGHYCRKCKIVLEADGENLAFSFWSIPRLHTPWLIERSVLKKYNFI